MEKFVKYFMFVMLASALIFAGCAKDDDDETPTTPTTTTYDLLTEYLISNNMDADEVIADWITTAENVATKGTDAWHIIDLRAADTYDAGHIEGAVNATLGGILAAAEGATKPILVVCYTGQTAGHAVMALRLSGYADAKVLKWGMAGWNSTTAAKWVDNTGDAAIGHANWIVPPIDITPDAEFALPVLTSESEDGATILAERVAALLEGGFMGVANADVLATPANYFINNYWALTDVEHYGHIMGAYRINPFTLEAGNDLNLDASKTVVTYCWTGQTSSMMTAYLVVLGYDAKSLKFGANGMIYSNLESHKYTVPTVDYPLVPTK
ncbi:MAG: rhodanese-like domain-containing protein [Bacteroidota bacterium]